MEKMVEDCGGLKPHILKKKDLDKLVGKDKKKTTAAKKPASAGKKK